jgi:hypothetical protein
MYASLSGYNTERKKFRLDGYSHTPIGHERDDKKSARDGETYILLAFFLCECKDILVKHYMKFNTKGKIAQILRLVNGERF